MNYALLLFVATPLIRHSGSRIIIDHRPSTIDHRPSTKTIITFPSKEQHHRRRDIEAKRAGSIHSGRRQEQHTYFHTWYWSCKQILQEWHSTRPANTESIQKTSPLLYNQGILMMTTKIIVLVMLTIHFISMYFNSTMQCNAIQVNAIQINSIQLLVSNEAMWI